jgi:hypothetical protein
MRRRFFHLTILEIRRQYALIHGRTKTIYPLFLDNLSVRSRPAFLPETIFPPVRPG